MAGEACGARRAVALADKELGRGPAFGTRGVKADEFPDRFDVLLDAVELFGLFRRNGAAVPGAHRVDKDQIGHVQ